MKNAQIPAITEYPPLATDIPAGDQAHVTQGAQAADGWISRAWDDGEPHLEHLARLTAQQEGHAKEAYCAGYLGRLHQLLRTPRLEPGQQLVSGSDELTLVLFELVKEVAVQGYKGNLKAKSFAARDLMRRVMQTADAMHDVTDEMSGVAGGSHE